MILLIMLVMMFIFLVFERMNKDKKRKIERLHKHNSYSEVRSKYDTNGVVLEEFYTKYLTFPTFNISKVGPLISDLLDRNKMGVYSKRGLDMYIEVASIVNNEMDGRSLYQPHREEVSYYYIMIIYAIENELTLRELATKINNVYDFLGMYFYDNKIPIIGIDKNGNNIDLLLNLIGNSDIQSDVPTREGDPYYLTIIDALYEHPDLHDSIKELINEKLEETDLVFEYVESRTLIPVNGDLGTTSDAYLDTLRKSQNNEVIIRKGSKPIDDGDHDIDIYEVIVMLASIALLIGSVMLLEILFT